MLPSVGALSKKSRIPKVALPLPVGVVHVGFVTAIQRWGHDMRNVLLKDRERRSGFQDDVSLSVIVVFGVALLATVAVRFLELPLDAGFLGLAG